VAGRTDSKNLTPPIGIDSRKSVNRDKLWQLGHIILILVAAVAIAAILIWQGITAAGNPNPTAPHTTLTSGALDIAVLVFREGLESILVLAAILAGLRGRNQVYNRPIQAGIGLGIVAGLITWFVAISIVSDLAQNFGALTVQAAAGIPAIIVLLIVMNWFFHNVYWSGWIGMHVRKKKSLIVQANDGAEMGQKNLSRLLFGLGVLGFASVFREAVEIVLFLQSYYLQLGSVVVYYGAAGGLVLTAAAGYLTLISHNRLPYRKMLIATGILLTGVLFVMVGEEINEMQLAGWIGTTSIPWLQGIPAWAGTWFSIFPNVQTIAAQVFAVLMVAGSYFLARSRILSGPTSPLAVTNV
jgi:high-affinity iron transporter